MALFVTASTSMAIFESFLLDSVKFRRLCKIEETNTELKDAHLRKLYLFNDDIAQKYKKVTKFLRIK